MKNPALTTAEHTLRKALADELTGLPEPVAADATICQAARDVLEAVRPFIMAEGIACAARELKGQDTRSREIREHLGACSESLYKRAVTAARERSAA